jgi:Family of unknown function (DUF5997)
MSSSPTSQTMKPATAAKKLGVYLPATPADFQEGSVSREELNALLADPPPWLVELRLQGPHPRPETARKLGISASGLLRSGVSDAMTTEEIRKLLADKPVWLEKERATQADVRAENARINARDADRRAQTERSD